MKIRLTHVLIILALLLGACSSPTAANPTPAMWIEIGTPSPAATAIPTQAPTIQPTAAPATLIPMATSVVTIPPEIPACVRTTPEERDLAWQVFGTLYPQLRNIYITSEGAGGFLRVRTPEMEDSTVSEGIGYWMLLSVLANDKTTFDGLWSYAKTYLNQNGLMSWQIMPDGKVPETDSASDGDQDIAWALYLAERTWGGYESDMKSMINAVMAYDIDPEKLVLKGGDAWSLTDGVSLAYTRPGYYPVFAGITGDDRWNQVLFNSLNLVDNLMTVSPAGTTGLVPDFMDIDSLPSEARGEESYVYSWVATRYPLFYAQALGLCGSSSGNRISGYLSLINGFFKSQRGNLVAGYTLDGRPLVDYQELTFISGTLTASAVSDDAAYRQQVLQTVINHPVDQYFGDSLRLLALAIFANRMGPTVLDYP